MPALRMKTKPLSSLREEHSLRVCRMSTKVSKDFSRLKPSQQPAIHDSNIQFSENVPSDLSFSDEYFELSGVVDLRVNVDGVLDQGAFALGLPDLALNGRMGSDLTTIFETLFSPIIAQEDAPAHLKADRDAVAGEQAELPHLIANESGDSRSPSDLQSSDRADYHTSDPNFSFCSNEECRLPNFTSILTGSECVNSQIIIDTEDKCNFLPYQEKNMESISVLDYSKEETPMKVDDSYLFLSIHQLKPPAEDTKSCFQSTESKEVDYCDLQLFLGNLPEVEEISSHCNLLHEKKRKQKPVTLVLDLDETLVHSSLDHCEDADFTFPVCLNMKEHTVYVRQRPHLHLFLERVAEMFEIVIFTASQSIYAERLLDILDPSKNIISKRKYRESCTFSGGSYTKDLSILGVDLARVAIIDNSPQVFQLQVNNGIPIKSWFDDPLDCALVSLLPFLETLSEADDVRPLIAKKFNNDGKEYLI